MKKSLLELLVGLALVAAWVLVAAQAERSQRLATTHVAALDARRLAAVEGAAADSTGTPGTARAATTAR